LEVIIADIVMSLDNGIALVTAIPPVVFGAALPTAPPDRFPMLVYVVAVIAGCRGYFSGRSATGREGPCS
jgi:hypothetical protein